MADTSSEKEGLVLNCGVSCFADDLTEYPQGILNPYLHSPLHRFSRTLYHVHLISEHQVFLFLLFLAWLLVFPQTAA